MIKHKKILNFDFYSKKSNTLKLFLLTFLILLTILLVIMNINTYIKHQHIVYKTSHDFMKNLNQINYLQVRYRENRNNQEVVREILPEFENCIKKSMNNIRTFERLLDNTITYYPLNME